MSELVVSNFVDTFVSNVVDKTKYDEFVEQVKVVEKITNERLDNTEQDIEKNKEMSGILNDCLIILYRDLNKQQQKVKGLIISNTITGIIAVAGVVLALIL